MNKKLFSWKALAGLALLVAMGLTSCKQGAEVDPSDPTGQTKPATPSTSTTGSADLTFTLTKTADLATLWSSVASDVKTDLAKKSEVTIQINAGNYTLDGNTLSIPAIFGSAASNKVLNIVFNGNFVGADKKALDVNLDNLSGALVNITIPAITFGSVVLDADLVKATVNSEGATIENADITAGTSKNAVVLNGITIGNLALTGDIIKGTNAAIVAKVVDADVTVTGKKGVAVGSYEYVNNLLVNADGITITNDKDNVLGAVEIAEGMTLNLATNPYINSVIGLGDGANVVLAGTADELANIGNMTKVVVTNGGIDLNLKEDKFVGVEFNEIVNITATKIADVFFDKTANVTVSDDNVTVEFENVDFDAQIDFNGEKSVEVATTKTTYQWDIENSKWVEVTASAPLTAANKLDAGVEVSSDKVSVSTAGALTDADNLVGAHTVFTIVKKETVELYPKNTTVVLTNCTYNEKAIDGKNISSVFAVDTWVNVTCNGKKYGWQLGSDNNYYLIAE